MPSRRVCLIRSWNAESAVCRISEALSLANVTPPSLSNTQSPSVIFARISARFGAGIPHYRFVIRNWQFECAILLDFSSFYVVNSNETWGNRPRLQSKRPPAERKRDSAQLQ